MNHSEIDEILKFMLKRIPFVIILSLLYSYYHKGIYPFGATLTNTHAYD